MNDDFWNRSDIISMHIGRLKLEYTESMRLAVSDELDLESEMYDEVDRVEKMLVFVMENFDLPTLAAKHKSSMSGLTEWWEEYQTRTQVTEEMAAAAWEARQAKKNGAMK